jgi:hypothetical protein
MSIQKKLHPHHEALNSLIDKVLAHKPKKGSRGKPLKRKAKPSTERK